jgi:hypothetical protein
VSCLGRESSFERVATSAERRGALDSVPRCTISGLRIGGYQISIFRGDSGVSSGGDGAELNGGADGAASSLTG